MLPPLAALPDAGYLLLGCVVIAIAAIGGIGYILSFGRKLVADLAAVVKNEISAQREAAPVAVQQPLVVSEHPQFITRGEFEKAEKLLKEDLTKQAGARKGLHEQVSALHGDMQALKATNAAQSTTLQELKADTKLTSSKVDQMIGETKQLNTQLQQLVLGMQKSP